MQDLVNFFWLWVASSASSITFVAIAGYLGRSQLSHWLSRDLERIKAQYQRDLEAYKVGLISRAESAKSNVEVRRAAALKIVEKKFTALDTFHKASAGMAADVLQFAQRRPDLKSKDESDALESRIGLLRMACTQLEIFLNEEELDTVNQYQGAFVPIRDACMPNSPSPSAEKFERLERELSKREMAVDKLVRSIAAEMQRID